jgi:MFS family permease
VNFPPGTTRNLGFAVLGAGQPIGFATGMVLSGVFIERLSWRWAFYCSAIVNLGVFVAAVWGLPKMKVTEGVGWRNFWTKVDWLGVALVSTSLGIFFYILAYRLLSSDGDCRIVSQSRKAFLLPSSIALTILATSLFPLFLLWERRQVRLHKPCILPLAVWKNRSFASICVAVLFSWATFNGVQYFATLT